MKIKNITFEEHHLFKDAKIDFRDSTRNASNITILLGKNGIGKTTMLRALACKNSGDIGSPQKIICEYELSETEGEKVFGENASTYADIGGKITIITKIISGYNRTKDPDHIEAFVQAKSGNSKLTDSELHNFTEVKRIVFIPAEMHVSKSESLKGEDSIGKVAVEQFIRLLLNWSVDKKALRQVSSFKKVILTELEGILFPEKKTTNFIGFLSEQAENQVNIGVLSSGQKQLLTKAALLYDSEQKLENSILLIDEPELSLNIDNQKKLTKILSAMIRGDNGPKVDQIFVTTHSPFIADSFLRENSAKILLLERHDKHLQVKDLSSYPTNNNNDIIRKAFGIDYFLSNKNVIFVEGETDEIYLKKCIQLFFPEGFPYEIKWVGALDGKGKISYSGIEALNKLKSFLLANAKLVPLKAIILYDSDANKPKEIHEQLLVEVIPFNSINTIFKKGIENLLQIPKGFPLDSYYDEKIKIDSYGAKSTIKTLNKKRLSLSVCDQPEELLLNIFEKIKLLLISLKDANYMPVSGDYSYQKQPSIHSEG